MVRLVDISLCLTSSRGRKRTHAHDVACYRIAKRKVARDGDQNIDERRNADAGDHDAGGSEVRIVVDLVQYRKHL